MIRRIQALNFRCLRYLDLRLDAQVLATTHSPALLGLVEPSEVLCFGKDEDGATDVVRGNEHPILASWQGSLDKHVLFAKGIIG